MNFSSEEIRKPIGKALRKINKEFPKETRLEFCGILFPKRTPCYTLLKKNNFLALQVSSFYIFESSNSVHKSVCEVEL